MFKAVVRVVENKHAEIGHIPEDSRNVEPGLAAAVKRCRRADSGEAAQVKCTVRLQFSDLFSAHGLGERTGAEPSRASEVSRSVASTDMSQELWRTESVRK